VLVATGRRPFTSKLGLEKAGIQVDKFGRIPINKRFETSTKGIYAIGDVVEGPMLAHKGEEEGVACIELICGEPGHVNYQAIPNVVYTHPEIAYVGLSEEELKTKGKI
jgi:dihydrolipoamide dehydrogenase